MSTSIGSKRIVAFLPFEHIQEAFKGSEPAQFRRIVALGSTASIAVSMMLKPASSEKTVITESSNTYMASRGDLRNDLKYYFAPSHPYYDEQAAAIRQKFLASMRDESQREACEQLVAAYEQLSIFHKVLSITEQYYGSGTVDDFLCVESNLVMEKVNAIQVKQFEHLPGSSPALKAMHRDILRMQAAQGLQLVQGQETQDSVGASQAQAAANHESIKRTLLDQQEADSEREMREHEQRCAQESRDLQRRAKDKKERVEGGLRDKEFFINQFQNLRSGQAGLGAAIADVGASVEAVPEEFELALQKAHHETVEAVTKKMVEVTDKTTAKIEEATQLIVTKCNMTKEQIDGWNKMDNDDIKTLAERIVSHLIDDGGATTRSKGVAAPASLIADVVKTVADSLLPHIPGIVQGVPAGTVPPPPPPPPAPPPPPHLPAPAPLMIKATKEKAKALETLGTIETQSRIQLDKDELIAQKAKLKSFSKQLASAKEDIKSALVQELHARIVDMRKVLDPASEDEDK